MKRVIVLLAVSVLVLGVGGGVASAGPAPAPPSQSTTNDQQTINVGQTSAIFATATNTVNVGGNTCVAFCPSFTIATNTLNATSTNVAVSTQTISQFNVNVNNPITINVNNVGPTVSITNVGNPVITVIGFQLVGG